MAIVPLGDYHEEVDVEGRCIEVYVEPALEGYAVRRLVGHKGSLALRAFPDVVVEAQRVFPQRSGGP